jgi:hypothetical protein
MVILNKKIKIADDNLLLLDYMIKSMEIRYQYNMDKLHALLQSKIAIQCISMISMLQMTFQKRPC